MSSDNFDGRKKTEGVVGSLSKKCVQLVEKFGKSLGENMWKGCGKICGKVVFGDFAVLEWWESWGFTRSFAKFYMLIYTGIFGFLPLFKWEFCMFST